MKMGDHYLESTATSDLNAITQQPLHLRDYSIYTHCMLLLLRLYSKITLCSLIVYMATKNKAN